MEYEIGHWNSLWYICYPGIMETWLVLLFIKYICGASTALFGLMGAVVYLSRKHGYIRSFANGNNTQDLSLSILSLDLLIQAVDNYGSLRGLVGGYLVMAAISFRGDRLTKPASRIAGIVAYFAHRIFTICTRMKDNAVIMKAYTSFMEWIQWKRKLLVLIWRNIHQICDYFTWRWSPTKMVDSYQHFRRRKPYRGRHYRLNSSSFRLIRTNKWNLLVSEWVLQVLLIERRVQLSAPTTSNWKHYNHWKKKSKEHLEFRSSSTMMPTLPHRRKMDGCWWRPTRCNLLYTWNRCWRWDYRWNRLIHGVAGAGGELGQLR